MLESTYYADTVYQHHVQLCQNYYTQNGYQTVSWLWTKTTVFVAATWFVICVKLIGISAKLQSFLLLYAIVKRNLCEN